MIHLNIIVINSHLDTNMIDLIITVMNLPIDTEMICLLIIVINPVLDMDMISIVPMMIIRYIMIIIEAEPLHGMATIAQHPMILIIDLLHTILLISFVFILKMNFIMYSPISPMVVSRLHLVHIKI